MYDILDPIVKQPNFHAGFLHTTSLVILGSALPLMVVGICIGLIYMVIKYGQTNYKLKKKQNSRSRYHVESTHISIPPLIINIHVFLCMFFSLFQYSYSADELATSR